MSNDLDVYKEGEEKQPETEGQVAVSAARAMQEVQGQIVMAKKFPRDVFTAVTRIVNSCERFKLAETAMYSYPRGGQMVTGPSIRLAEVMARNWGNLDFGVRALEQKNGETTLEAYCWDLETNVRMAKVFHVKHERHTKRGSYKLTDPRDIYELEANNGSRRMRACILSIIPADVVQDAVAACEMTLAKGPKNVPFEERLKKMVIAFKDLHIKQEDLEDRLGHKIDSTNATELVTLQKIYTSLKDGVSKRGDWFEGYKNDDAGKKVNELNDKFKNKKDGEKNE